MIKYISLSDIKNQNILNNYIYNNEVSNYYYTDDYSVEMYDTLAYLGFISITHTDKASNNEFLLPEIQFSYAVLQWNKLHISKRLKKLMRTIVNDENYYITIDKSFDKVANKIKNYHKDINWMTDKYISTLKSCIKSNSKTRIVSIELWDNEKLIAGEIGYINGSIYTSLTGFFDKKNYSNFGKIQLISWALILKNLGFAFWNMGHPYMDYKFKIGAIEYLRRDFLTIWKANRENVINLTDKKFKLKELFSNYL